MGDSMNKFKDYKLTILIILIIIGIIVFMIYKSVQVNRENEDYEETEYIMSPKTYNVNEYVKVNITDEQMAVIYFNDYKSYLNKDMEKAYNLLDEDYKNRKFSSFSVFKDYIENLEINNLKLQKYAITNKEDYKYYIISLSNNQKIVFKTNGVMQYSVYLDNETVVIK